MILAHSQESQNHSFWPLSAVPGPMLVMFRGCKCPGWCLSRWMCHFGLKMMFGDFWPIFPWFGGGVKTTKMTQSHCIWPVSAVPGPMLVMFRGCKCPGVSRCICHFGLKMIFLDFWPLFPLFLTLFIYAYIRIYTPKGHLAPLPLLVEADDDWESCSRRIQEVVLGALGVIWRLWVVWEATVQPSKSRLWVKSLYIYAQGPFGSPAIARTGWWWLGKL